MTFLTISNKPVVFLGGMGSGARLPTSLFRGEVGQFAPDGSKCPPPKGGANIHFSEHAQPEERQGQGLLGEYNVYSNTSSGKVGPDFCFVFLFIHITNNWDFAGSSL